MVDAVLMDLSKAFDCLPHELLIANLAAYDGFDDKSLKLFYSYFKTKKQAVNIKGKLSKLMYTVLLPYKYNSLSFPRRVKLCFCKISTTLEGRGTRGSVCNRQ